MFDTQIVVSGELKEAEQIWLRALAPGLEKSVLDVFLQKTSGALTQGWRDLMDSVLEVVLAANKQKVSVLKGDEREMSETLRELMADEIEEAMKKAVEEAVEEAVEKTVKKTEAKGRIVNQTRIALKMLRAEKPEEEIREFTEIEENDLQALKMLCAGKTEAYIQEATGISEDKLGLMREQV